MAIYSPLTIDTIEMVVTVPSAELYAGLWSQLHALHDDAASILPGWKVQRKNVGFAAARVTFSPAWRRPIAAIELGVSPSKQHWMKVALFPNYFRGAEFQLWQERFAAYFQEYAYPRFFFEARVTRLDLAIDSYSVFMDEVIPYWPLVRSSRRHQNPDGSLGTLYLGSETSNKFFRIYDKKRHLVETKKKGAPFSKITRFEIMLRALGCATCELHELVVNPFTVLKVVRRAEAVASFPDDAEWGVFLARAGQIGSAAALKHHVYKRRRQFRRRLAKLAFPLPAQDWPYSLELAVTRIAPP